MALIVNKLLIYLGGVQSWLWANIILVNAQVASDPKAPLSTNCIPLYFFIMAGERVTKEIKYCLDSYRLS